jgi:hypothetical protein
MAPFQLPWEGNCHVHPFGLHSRQRRPGARRSDAGHNKRRGDEVEPFFWLAIFVICAYIIATTCSSRFFLHGLLVSIVNSVWITAAHIAFADQYLARHAQEAAMMSSMPLPDSPRLMMAMTGPVIGVVSGLVLGAFAFVASKLVAPRPRPVLR